MAQKPFPLSAETEHDRKKIYTFYQWLNLTHLANDSSLSLVTVVTISAGTPE